MITEEPEYYTARETAAKLRIHPVTLRKRVAEGIYPHSRNGRRLMFTPEQIAAIKRSQERPAVKSA